MQRQLVIRALSRQGPSSLGKGYPPSCLPARRNGEREGGKEGKKERKKEGREGGRTEGRYKGGRKGKKMDGKR